MIQVNMVKGPEQATSEKSTAFTVRELAQKLNEPADQLQQNIDEGVQQGRFTSIGKDGDGFAIYVPTDEVQ